MISNYPADVASKIVAGGAPARWRPVFFAPARFPLRLHRAALVALSLLLAVLTAGCETTTTRLYPPGVAAGRRTALNPDAQRLQTISGALLLYFQQHHRLPESLGELTPLNPGGSGPPLKLTCPTTGRPYIYAPAAIPGDPAHRWLLVYDPTPAQGRCWMILGQPPLGRQPVMMWVVSLDETTFERLRRATTQPRRSLTPPTRP